MKDLLKISFGLALLFASIFMIMRYTGLLPEEDVRAFLTEAHTIHPGWFVVIVISLLWLDLVIAVPTLATMLLSGYFLGPVAGPATSIAGLLVMGLTGYGLGWHYGDRLLTRLYKDDEIRIEAIRGSFARNDLLVLFVCQAIPILPELCSCLAGIAKLSLRRFMFGYSVGVIPFASIAGYAGSISTANDPSPAIMAAIGLTTALLIVWMLVQRLTRKQKL